MEGFLSLLATMDPSTQAGYRACLAAFKAQYPSGVVDDTQGQVILTANGKTVRVLGDDMYAVGQPCGPDAEQLVASWFAEAAIADPPPAVKPPHVDPGPVLDVPFQDVDGKWYKYSGPFMFKVSCEAPVGAAPNDAMDTAKAKVIGIIRTRLSAQPPKPQIVVDELISLAIEVNAIPD